MSVPEIVDQVRQAAESGEVPTNHVVLTGGEPMLQRELNQLCEAVKTAGFHITIETAGTIFHLSLIHI